MKCNTEEISTPTIRNHVLEGSKAGGVRKTERKSVG